MQKILHENIASALILEDDVDWDISIREQLQQVARATHALTQPLATDNADAPPTYADPTFPQANTSSPASVPDIPLDAAPPTAPPTASPYGDNWDLLWVGHCGMRFPHDDNQVIPKGRVVWDDPTVPGAAHLKNYHYWENDPRQANRAYPGHQRVVHHEQEGVCTFGYAVTLHSARQMLFELALKPMNAAVDIELRDFCEGVMGHSYHRCVTVQPPLFNTHRGVGNIKGDSDNSVPGEGFRSSAYTENVRWSVRLNAEELINGGTNFVDQFPEVPV